LAYKDKQKQKEYSALWHQKNRARILSRLKNYRENNKEKIKAYRESLDKEEVARYQKKYHKEWKEKSRGRLNAYRRKWERSVREELRLLLGGVCIICKGSDGLHIDHVFGGGKAEAERFGKQFRNMWSYYLKHPSEAKEKLQILCRKHNHEKENVLRELGYLYLKENGLTIEELILARQ